jgi:hypothetical protein
VVSVADSGGLMNAATMNIEVSAAPPIVAALASQPAGLELSWSGGIAPYQVQATTNLAELNWENVGGTISSNSLSIMPADAAMFYRIIGQ